MSRVVSSKGEKAIIKKVRGKSPYPSVMCKGCERSSKPQLAAVPIGSEFSTILDDQGEETIGPRPVSVAVAIYSYCGHCKTIHAGGLAVASLVQDDPEHEEELKAEVDRLTNLYYEGGLDE
jgi:hypothetical protein